MTHFVLIGAVLFAVEHYWRESSDDRGRQARPGRESILLAQEDVARIRRDWTAQHGSPPDAEEERRTIARAVEEEILAREALRLDLDRGDRLVRDRLVKLGRFLGLADDAEENALEREARALGLGREDPVIRRYLVHLMEIALAGAPAPPSEAQVRRRYDRLAGELDPPDRSRLSQVYLSRDARGGALRTDAEQLLAHLRAGGVGPDDAAALGDPFATGSRFGPASAVELARAFGPELAAAVESAPTGQWWGPLRSSYGLHLVWVHERLPGRVPELDVVRNRIVWDLVREQQAQRLHDRVNDLRRRYRVEVAGS